jgi:hypothetical protein
VALASSIVLLVLTCATAFAMLGHGLVGVASGLAIQAYVLAPFGFLLLGRFLGVSPRSLLRVLLPPLFSAAAMALSVLALRLFYLDELSPSVRLPIAVGLGVCVYALALMMSGRMLVIEMRKELLSVWMGAAGRADRT